tara:strand:+ start:27 stop:917 length:891 start_codon:yes stop_codon:yes gene_type:complete
MTPPLPTIPSQPTVAAATGGTWASGNSQSDASGALAYAEYAEYRQWLNIEYSRNPDMAYSVSPASHYSLTQLSAVDVKDVRRTGLHMVVTAHTSCTIVSGVYAASSFYQPQKLSMTPYEHDKEGVSYGSVDGSGVVFGPHGTITTTQPYINRRPRQALDFPYNETNTGTNHILSLSATAWYPGDNTAQPYEYYLSEWYDLNSADDMFTADNKSWGESFELYGPYNVSAEPGYLNPTAGMQRLEQFIENVASAIRNSSHYYRYIVPLPVYTTPGHTPLESDRIPAMTKYNSSLHDYT